MGIEPSVNLKEKLGLVSLLCQAWTVPLSNMFWFIRPSLKS